MALLILRAKGHFKKIEFGLTPQLIKPRSRTKAPK